MAEERTSIRELARLSGVSVGTVSRALNGYADVRPETRERIMRLARGARLHARRLGAHARHPALARDRRLPRDGRGPPGPPAPVLPRGARRLKDRLGAPGYDLLLFACERPGNGYGDALLPQALPPPQRRRRRADGRRRARTRRCAGWCAPTSPCVGVDVELRRARAPSYVMSDNVARRAPRPFATCTGWATAASPRSPACSTRRPGADRLRGYRRRAAGRLGLALPRRVRRARRLLRRERPAGGPAAARARPSRRPRSSPRPT